MASSPHTRDAGVRRIGRLTRWALAGAVGLSTVVSFVVAKAQTGAATSRGSGDASRAGTIASQAPVVIGPSTDTGDALQPPPTPPVRQGGGGGNGRAATSGGS
ncbi:MAG: hypothetical protein ABI635_11440 [Actinomycetota bacterium]